MSGDICGCRTQAEGNTGTYGTEAEEAAKHLTTHRTGPTPHPKERMSWPKMWIVPSLRIPILDHSDSQVPVDGSEKCRNCASACPSAHNTESSLQHPGSSHGKESTCNLGDVGWSLGREDPLEKGKVTHSSILPWRISWTDEPARLQSMGSQGVGHDWATFTCSCQLLPATSPKGSFMLSKVWVSSS